jgi:hypothetical protein
MRRNRQFERAVDLGAAGMFAAAVAVSASALATGLLAAVVGPAAFALAYSLLSRVDLRRHELQASSVGLIAQPLREPEAMGDGKVVRLFDRPPPVTRPRAADAAAHDGGQDAGQALSDALAQLKRSLR